MRFQTERNDIGRSSTCIRFYVSFCTLLFALSMVYCQFKVYSPKLNHFPFCVLSLSPANIYIVSLSLYRKHFYSQIFLFSLCLSCKNLITTPPIATSQFKSPERLTHVYLTVFSQNHPSPLTQGTVTCPRLTQPHTRGIVSRQSGPRSELPLCMSI